MPERKTMKRAQADLRQGKSASTAAGEFVREEMHHIREGKHGARNAKQAIAIGLSKARRAGVPLEPPARGETSEATRHDAERAVEAGKHDGASHHPSPKRSQAMLRALQREPKRAASHEALSRHAKAAATRGHRAAAHHR
jgi:hypothetical protein